MQWLTDSVSKSLVQFQPLKGCVRKCIWLKNVLNKKMCSCLLWESLVTREQLKVAS